MAIKNKKIDFHKNRILTPTVEAKSEKMTTFSLESVEWIMRYQHIRTYTHTHTLTHTHTSIRTYSKNSVFRFQIC